MQYQSDFAINFWKKLLLNSKRLGNNFQIHGNLIVFGESGAGKIDLSMALPVLVELANTNPVGVKLEDVKIKKRYLDDYKKKIENYNNRQRAATITSPSRGLPQLKEADPYCGLVENVYEKVVANQALNKSELESVLVLFSDRNDDVYDYITLKAEILLLEDRYNEYIDAFIQGDLIAPMGTRYFSAERQRQIIWDKIKELADDQGAKNFIFTLEDILGVYYSHTHTDPSNTMQCRRFEPLFSLERTGDIEILQMRENEQIRNYEFVLSLGIKHLKGSVDLPKAMPSYTKFEGKFEENELHWYCPVCGRKVKVFESRGELEKFLVDGGVKKCERGHENRITIIDDKVVFEHTPLLVSTAMDAFKALHKKSTVTRVDKNSKSE